MIELGRRRSVSQSHLLQLLTNQLDDLVAGEWRPLDIVDVGGGTGVVAIPLASGGHRVTVELEGYQPYTATAIVNPNRVTRVAARLQRR